MANADEMLDEALRMGSQAATQASRYMSLATDLVVAVNEAVKHLECGRADKARELLIAARKHAGQVALPVGTDLVETVMRSIAQIREQNGAAPYDGWDAIHGHKAAELARRQLREEAVAVLGSLGIRKE